MEQASVTNKALARQLQCPLCAGLILEPRYLPCGHTFCKTCVENCSRQKKLCPECRHPFRMNQVRPHLLITKIVEGLQSSCLTEGCSWKGRLKEYLKHRQCNCVMKRVLGRKENQDKGEHSAGLFDRLLSSDFTKAAESIAIYASQLEAKEEERKEEEAGADFLI